MANNTKHTKIDKANTVLIATIGVAAFVVVFTLVTVKTLFSQYAYQNRVIAAKNVAVSQLKSDVSAETSLVSAFNKFDSGSTNIIGGSTSGTGQNGGSNATIVDHALPSQYDFPGLVSSLDSVLSNQGYTIESITGTDEEIAQQNSTASASPQTVEIPFQISVTGPYTSIQTLVTTLQNSIRPFSIKSINLSGSDSALSATISAYTYYQPPKTFTIGTEIVK